MFVIKTLAEAYLQKKDMQQIIKKLKNKNVIEVKIYCKANVL